MRDEAHIGLVDAHAEGDRRHHDDAVLIQKAAQVARAHLGGQPGVIGQGVDAVAREHPRHFFHRVARQAIHHAAIARVFAADELQQLRAAIALFHHAVADVGAVEAGDELGAVVQQALHDFMARGYVGGGGERHPRHLRPALAQHGKLAVLGAKIVPPLRHAMRLVDGEQGDAAVVEQALAALTQQPFGCHVEQVQLAAPRLLLHLARGLRIERGVEERRAYTQLAQRGDLVLHQRDQRRDDDAQPLAQQCRNLEAQRLAAARGHEHQRIVAAEHMVDNRALLSAERRVAPDVLQQVSGVGVGGQCIHRRAWLQVG